MKVSGREVANAILKKLEKEIKRKNLKPALAIILAGNDPSSRIYVNNKIKAALQIGIKAKLFEFSKSEYDKCLQTIQKLNKDRQYHGIIVQYPTYGNWDFDNLAAKIDPKKDVDGFNPASPFAGATAMAVWEMLTAFAILEGFPKAENFLQKKNIVVLGKGKTAGGPIIKMFRNNGFNPVVVDLQTKNPTAIIKKGMVLISATGVKNILNKTNVKKGSFVIGVGVGKELAEGKEKIYGDINEEEISKLVKLYCPTIGGIGPLTIVSLLKNVVQSASHSSE